MRRIYNYIVHKLKYVSSSVKKSWRRFKYLDKTKLQYYIVVSFLGIFCLFTGISYSAFNLLSDFFDVANITIAKLSYNVTINSCENCTITDGESQYLSINAKAGISIVELSITSLNKNFMNASEAVASNKQFNTKYALNYSSTNTGITPFQASDNVSVYYSYNHADNMKGQIGPHGSVITPLRVVVMNNSGGDKTVYFTVLGGYLQNIIETNITAGYYEKDISIRTVLLDNNYDFKQRLDSFPTNTSNMSYAYYKTECSDPNATATWDYDNYQIEISSATQTACDVYFKEMCSDTSGNTCTDIEINYSIKDSEGNTTSSSNPPATDGYVFTKGECSTDSTLSSVWDSTNNKWQTTVSNISSPTLCTAYFEEGEVITSSEDSPIKLLDTNDQVVSSINSLHVPVGQKIAIGTEKFYVISNNAGTIRALAEYNLNVGSNKNSEVTEGLQHETVKGYIESGTKYGNVAFYSGSTKSPDAYTQYNADGTTAEIAADKGLTNYAYSDIKTYVDAYKDTLNGASLGNGIVTSADLISFNELRTLGCTRTELGGVSNTCTGAPDWVYSSSYWSGSAYDDDDVWYVLSIGLFFSSHYNNDSSFGVRPVITINESSF